MAHAIFAGWNHGSGCCVRNCLPLVNIASTKVGLIWQADLVAVFLVSKPGFERIGKALFSRLGADIMPSFVFLGGIAYWVHFCCQKMASGGYA